jgi:hypothetical protein
VLKLTFSKCGCNRSDWDFVDFARISCVKIRDEELPYVNTVQLRSMGDRIVKLGG